ncbi:hypothetical protein J1614_000768 [Plenodomus biglobosus]|nr:hypothetical protein J1614_000768 [Plenodomus biglobosus]
MAERQVKAAIKHKSREVGRVSCPLIKKGILTNDARLRKPGHKYSLEDPADVEKSQAAERKRAGTASNQKVGSQGATFVRWPEIPELIAKNAQLAPINVISQKMQGSESTSSNGPHTTDRESDSSFTTHSETESDISSREGHDQTGGDENDEPDFSLMHELMPDANRDGKSHGMEHGIEHGPLLSQSIVAEHAKDLVPQYGFLGCLHDETASGSADVKMFQNTNVPFSAFVCGVQGSGKSHTTATMLENALIPSRHLGRLVAPASALVFSYGDWVDGGVGFQISEATHLAKSLPAYPGARVKRITVLVSPSNPGIKNSYQGPNIRVVPFTLNAKALNISALLTLMGVNETATTPLYMARVEAILRSIARNSLDGSLDYKLFKDLLAKEKFDMTQKTMLDMRLNLLESFLDVTGKGADLEYLPGEMTIMDFSDPFVTPNTACILFKLGLDRFIHSSHSSAKVVVLDEAHKVCLPPPFAWLFSLTGFSTCSIHLERRCSTNASRLLSGCRDTKLPAWYAALRQHISAMVGGDDGGVMRQIEELETGEALIFSPLAVLCKDDEGALVKATGRLMKLRIRKRITTDGGESIMAV